MYYICVQGYYHMCVNPTAPSVFVPRCIILAFKKRCELALNFGYEFGLWLIWLRCVHLCLYSIQLLISEFICEEWFLEFAAVWFREAEAIH